jgi:DNA/RNA endonuclease YhcR with UshA esterase domain
MKKLLVVFLLGISLLVYAQKVEKPVVASKKIICVSVKKAMADLKEKYGEEPIVMGNVTNIEDAKMAVFINPDTGSFTVIEFDDAAACIISVGKDARYRTPKANLM